MALKYEVSYQQVRTWTLRYEELGAAGLEDRRGKRKAEMERDLLKKLDEVVRRVPIASKTTAPWRDSGAS